LNNGIAELEKLDNVHEEIRTIEHFLEFLSGKGILLCNPTDDTKTSMSYVPITISDMKNLIYEDYDIDPIKLEQERRQLLESLPK